MSSTDKGSAGAVAKKSEAEKTPSTPDPSDLPGLVNAPPLNAPAAIATATPGNDAASKEGAVRSVPADVAANQGLPVAHHENSAPGLNPAAQPDQKTAFAAALPAAPVTARPADQAVPSADALGLASIGLDGTALALQATSLAAPSPIISPGTGLSTAGVPPAVHQVTAALVSMGAGPDPGTQRLTIAMTPAALGQVIIHIDRLPDGSAAVAVSASHAATLAVLHNDRPALEQALTQAGIPVSHRTMEFRLETPAPSGGGGSALQSGLSGSMSGNASGQQGRQALKNGTVLASSNPVPLTDPEPTGPITRRFGLNLTA